MENRQTKIICTIGNASSSSEQLLELVKNGMNIARLNMSHGTHETHVSVIQTIRAIENQMKTRIAIALDTKGPELRVKLKSDELAIKKGDSVYLSNKDVNAMCYVEYVNLLDLSEGTHIYIDDGILKLEVVCAEKELLKTIALTNHTIKSGKAINIPGIPLGLPYLSEKDKEDILFGLKNKVDFIFASFVSSSEDLHQINHFIEEHDAKPEIIAKIESVGGLKNLPEILKDCDGVMIARGDLAVEIGIERVFSEQKEITKQCLKSGKILICATQMMESMRFNSVPTRAEVSDVGNAILDGCDCVMLSAESASGKFPVETLIMMGKICIEAENYMKKAKFLPKMRRHTEIAEKMKDNHVTKLFIQTNNLEIVDNMRQIYDNIQIIVITEDEQLIKKLSIRKGCVGIFHITTFPVDRKKIEDFIFKEKLISYGEAGIFIFDTNKIEPELFDLIVG